MKIHIETTVDRTYWPVKPVKVQQWNAVMLIEDDGTPEGGEMLAVVPNREDIIDLVKTALEGAE